MNNSEVAEVFDNIADFLEIKGEQIYRVLAYRRGAEAIRNLGRDINKVWQDEQLQDIPGVGKAISEKIAELLSSGQLEYYERLQAEIPVGLLQVLKVGDVGPKKAARFWKELGIESIQQLEKAARAGQLRQLSGMGEKSEARILESIESLKRRKIDRIPIGQALPAAQLLVDFLRELPEVTAAEAAGSLRRQRETVGDLDLLVAATDKEAVMAAFAEMPSVHRVKGLGGTKVSVELVDGLRVQLWVHPPERFGTALQYATGSQAHNVKLREMALDQGVSLSEHALTREDGSEILCAEEEQVYAALGLPWIPPELREDRGEIQAAKEGALPDLVTLDQVRGELHAHSDWSDGAVSIEAMARGAKERGLRYLIITDHSRSLGVANGLSIERLRQQRKELETARRAMGKGFTLLQGAEVEILADGKLDYPDEVLAELDLVIASLHTSLRQSRERVTRRLMNAIQNPHVDLIAHPTGRLIGQREGADLDMESILQAAADHDVILEINANPERLDLNDVFARRALELGCRLAINTDAHRPEHLDFRHYGLGVARRAWATADQVVNCWTAARLKRWAAARGK
ncbi:MAG TPA: DNA polymerase/3'-5' exonuclease PolX [Anaerolineales bacterium]|nr:DNA polymerase/3'-5' exonuclease PolX [Anaerolineales bacterium]